MELIPEALENLFVIAGLCAGKKKNVDMVYPYGDGYIRNIRAYTMGTHGGPHWEPYKKVWFWQQWVSNIYPDEISALWYTDIYGEFDNGKSICELWR